MSEAVEEEIFTISRAQQHEPANPGEDFFEPIEWARIIQVTRLSWRHIAIVALIVEGCTYEEIARRLHHNGKAISVSTVHSHMDRIRTRLGVADTIGVVMRIMRIHRMICAALANSSGSN